MSFSTTYTRTKTFVNGGTLLPSDLNSIQDDLGNQLAVVNVAGGFNEGSNIRRGKSIIATEQSRTNTAFGVLTTPDQLANVVVPTDGLLFVKYSALVKSSTAGLGSAAIFIDSSQMTILNNAGAPSTSGTQNFSAVDNDYGWVYTGDITRPFSSTDSAGNSTRDSSPIVVGAPVVFELAAGTYTVSIRFKSTAGSISAKDRKLWVWSQGF